MGADRALYQAILDGDAKLARSVAEDAVSSGADPQSLVDEQMIPAMDEVGRLFECHEYFVPEMLISARAMRSALEVVQSRLVLAETASRGKIVIGTVKGDLHDIGKNLVSAMLQGGGYQIFDLGTDVPAEKFVEAIEEHHPVAIAMSALLTTTMPEMKNVIEALVSAGVRQRVKVLVGGAPVTEEFARQIGADGYGETAVAAVGLMRSLISTATA
jgi:corrinoid protein of di/trimethylamine methyltransferase